MDTYTLSLRQIGVSAMCEGNSRDMSIVVWWMRGFDEKFCRPQISGLEEMGSKIFSSFWILVQRKNLRLN